MKRATRLALATLTVVVMSLSGCASQSEAQTWAQAKWDKLSPDGRTTVCSLWNGTGVGKATHSQVVDMDMAFVGLGLDAVGDALPTDQARAALTEMYDQNCG
jgi:hypothetical protein